MSWINKLVALTVTGVALAGCASQDTILPSADRDMVDIFREALNESSGEVTPNTASAICADLDLDEPVGTCEAKLAAFDQARYSVIESRSTPQGMDYVPYTRDQQTEIDNLFPRLANPDLVIYVYPHLATRARAPIPGYSTVIPLYDRVEYRLPGEALAETPLPPLAAPTESEVAP